MSVFQNDCLAGRVALVTGGGSGICRGIAEAFMAHGCDVVITSRNEERLKEAAESLSATTGRRCLPVAADVRDPERVDAAVARCLETFGQLDILVNGAAGNFLAPAVSLSPKGFRTVLEIDTCGTFNMSRAVFQQAMRDSGGVILNISATLHYNGTPLQVHAGSAKAAVDAMTRHLAVEWGPAGVRVNGIAPGPVDDTEGVRRLLPAGMRETLERSIPLGRMSKISEIADASVFLASDAAACISGHVLVVDGGAWLTAPGLRMG